MIEVAIRIAMSGEKIERKTALMAIGPGQVDDVIVGVDGVRANIQWHLGWIEDALVGYGVNTAGAVMAQPEIMKIGVQAFGKIDAEIVAVVCKKSIGHSSFGLGEFNLIRAIKALFASQVKRY